MEKQDNLSIAHRYLSNTISKVTSLPTHELKNYNTAENVNSFFFTHGFGTYELEAKFSYGKGSPQKVALT